MVERFERFSYAIFEISRYWHKLTTEEMEKYGLKGPHSIYLVVMHRFPDGITAPQLCEYCGKAASQCGPEHLQEPGNSLPSPLSQKLACTL